MTKTKKLGQKVPSCIKFLFLNDIQGVNRESGGISAFSDSLKYFFMKRDSQLPNSWQDCSGILCGNIDGSRIPVGHVHDRFPGSLHLQGFHQECQGVPTEIPVAYNFYMGVT